MKPTSLPIASLCGLAAFAVPALAQTSPPTAAPSPPAPAPKASLHVLYVGDDPAAPKIMFADMADERTVELHKERTPAFTAFLNERFKQVTVVYGDDYTAALSDAVDVTIFDTRPKALIPSSRKVDPETGETDYQPAHYLPLDFDSPAITISANSPTIGEPLGLKLDWL